VPIIERGPVPVPSVPAAPDAGARRQCLHILRAVMEAWCGRRPVTQLRTYLTGPALRYVRAAVGGPCRPNGPTRIVRVRIDEPDAGTVELAAVIRVGARCRALAARFERRGRTAPGHWTCVPLRLG